MATCSLAARLARVDASRRRAASSAPVAAPLFTEYLLAFEVTSVLLLAAMVGAVVLGRKRGGGAAADVAEATTGGASAPPAVVTMLADALFFSAVLFAIGVVGVLTRRNAIIVFMCVELMLNAVNLTFVAFSQVYGCDGAGVRRVRHDRRGGRSRRRTRDHHLDLPAPAKRQSQGHQSAERLMLLPGTRGLHAGTALRIRLTVRREWMCGCSPCCRCSVSCSTARSRSSARRRSARPIPAAGRTWAHGAEPTRRCASRRSQHRARRPSTRRGTGTPALVSLIGPARAHRSRSRSRARSVRRCVGGHRHDAVHRALLPMDAGRRPADRRRRSSSTSSRW